MPENWDSLEHTQKISLLTETSVEELSKRFTKTGLDEAAFARYLASQKKTWTVQSVSAPERIKRAPSKAILLGAQRDLGIAEALLELIDNSIDQWRQRRKAYPKATAKELQIFIDLDEAAAQLTYMDNAGGVPEDKLHNLVIPGSSDTLDTSATIGSYKTGGKKAIFRLAREANLLTFYSNPVGTPGDKPFSVQLPESWMTSEEEYEFNRYTINDPSDLDLPKGTTKFLLALKDDGGLAWFKDEEKISQVIREIEKTYALLLLNEPNIQIHFNNRKEALESTFPDMYECSGANTTSLDLRPRLKEFELELETGPGTKQTVKIQVWMACRTSVGVSGPSKYWGVDLYGNDRLFKTNAEEIFGNYYQSGNARFYFRGFVNIIGPNIFVPWDTHKRHVNIDHPMAKLLAGARSEIKQHFYQWREIYQKLSIVGSDARVSAALRTKFVPNPSKSGIQAWSAQAATIKLADKKRGQQQKSIQAELKKHHYTDPRVNVKSKKSAPQFDIRFSLAEPEASQLSTLYGMDVKPGDKGYSKALSEAVKENILSKAMPERKRSKPARKTS